MPFASRTLLLLLLALGAGTARAQSAELVGTWELVTIGADTLNVGTLGAEMTFGTDGSLTVRFTTPNPQIESPPPGTYRVQGDTITVEFGDAKQPARYWFETGDLYLDDGFDVMQLRRKRGG